VEHISDRDGATAHPDDCPDALVPEAEVPARLQVGAVQRNPAASDASGVSHQDATAVVHLARDAGAERLADPEPVYPARDAMQSARRVLADHSAAALCKPAVVPSVERSFADPGLAVWFAASREQRVSVAQVRSAQLVHERQGLQARKFVEAAESAQLGQ
jgi:hypothetical protein